MSKEGDTGVYQPSSIHSPPHLTDIKGSGFDLRHLTGEKGVFQKK